MRRQALLAPPLVKVDFAAHGKIGIEQPRIDPEQTPKLVGYFVVRGKMVRLAPHRPTCMQRWQQYLLVKPAQNVRNAGRQIVVQKNRARIEARQTQSRS